ncbi:MAG: NAD(P)-dependent oxidoreductase [Deltaproteobacteria bacterium]|nr:NAD(P)-dependent oxidoreductase [Deltaproteobacteria bacterium]
MENLAFFGLGQMGQGMVLRLLESGYRLGVYNRTREKAGAAVEKGAELFDKPATAVGAAGLLITMLADDNAVAELVTEEVLQALGKGSVHLSMSTLSPAAVQNLLPRHARHGVQYLACPVFGRPDAARAGKLWLCLAGDEEAKSRVRPLLDVMGQGVFDFGGHPPAANVVKLAGNFLIASAIEAMAEAFSLVEKNGADPSQAHALLTQTLFACPIYQNYGKFILDQSYDPPGFNLALGSKDVRLVRDTARESQVPMPLAGLLEDRFLRSLANGRENLDWTAIAIDQRESAGLTDN